MRYLRLSVLLALPLLAGCFPIELDVAKDGRVLIPRQEGFFVLDPAAGKVTKACAFEKGQPVFGRFTPDGKSIVAVTAENSEFVFRLVNLADGKARQLLSASNTTYVRVSPDGQNLALCRVADEKVAPLEEQLPELKVIPLQEGGKETKVASNTGSQHRWFADSKRLLAFQIKKKDDKGRYWGQLVAIEAATGKAQPLAEAIGSQSVYFDVSPDGQKVLLTAFAAGATGTELKAPEQDAAKLFEVDLAAGKVRDVGRKADFAMWSPDGKRVLVSGEAQDGKRTLDVADAALAKFETVAKDAADKAGGMGNEVSIYPGWANADTVLYLARKAVYGTLGINYELATVSADGKTRRSFQTLIDAEAGK